MLRHSEESYDSRRLCNHNSAKWKVLFSAEPSISLNYDYTLACSCNGGSVNVQQMHESNCGKKNCDSRCNLIILCTWCCTIKKQTKTTRGLGTSANTSHELLLNMRLSLHSPLHTYSWFETSMFSVVVLSKTYLASTRSVLCRDLTIAAVYFVAI